MKAVTMRPRGFTLIELVIAVAIAAILATIATNAYTDSVRKTRRGDAKAALSGLAQRLERCNTVYGVYNHANCAVPSPQNSAQNFYTVVTVRTATTFSLTATPVKTDAQCATFTLTNTGTKTATGTDAARCW